MKPPHTLGLVSLLGSDDARCLFTRSCVTSLPDFFQSPQNPFNTTHTVAPRTSCSFSHTLATCHWKESITLSAHWKRAVRRPVGDKAFRAKNASLKDKPSIGSKGLAEAQLYYISSSLSWSILPNTTCTQSLPRFVKSLTLINNSKFAKTFNTT